MKCRSCRRDIPDNSIFCNWCGEKQIRERKKKTEIKVPKPRQLRSGKWNIELKAEGWSTTENTAEECIVKAKAVRAGFIEAKKNAPKMTVREAMQRYIDRRALLSPSTILGYQNIMRNRFKSVMDKDVSSIDWQAAINAEAEGCSPKTVINAWRTVKAALTEAGAPVPVVVLPKHVKRDLPWLDYEQIQIFLDAIRGTPGELGALLALHSLRKSEVLALTVAKIDTRKKLIKVEGADVVGPNGLTHKDTNKTSASRREVPIMIPRLLELIPKAPSDTRLVDGYSNTLYRRINAACRDAGLPLVGVHGLRRSFASLAYHLNWDMLTTMRIGGWDDDKIVKEIYTKLAAKDVDANVERMRDFYSANSERISERTSTPV